MIPSTSYHLGHPSRGASRCDSIRRILPHTVGHPFVEIIAPHHRLDAGVPHPFAHFVAHASKRYGDSLVLQLLDGRQHDVAGAGVDQIHRLDIQEYALRWMPDQCTLQPILEMADTGEEQVIAGAPDQETGEG